MSRRRRATASAASINEDAEPPAPTNAIRARPLFIASIALSAFLLFSLELLAGRLVLPIFGGSPAVWTTALCFFTGVLFAGYLYAHVVVTRLGRRLGGIVHLGLALIVVAATLAAPVDLGGLRNPQLPEALNVLLALGLISGPAIFLLATTSPLLSAWFAGRGGDPWWLYAASNAASLAGLLAYPIVIEPFLPLSVQRGFVIVLLIGLVALLTAVVVSGRRSAPGPDRPPVASRTALDGQAAAVLAPRGGGPGWAPLGNDDAPCDRPHLGAPPVGRTAGDLPGQSRRRLLGARPADPPGR